MTTIFARTALLPEGWAENVIIEYDDEGWIVGVDSFKPLPKNSKSVEIIDDPILPGMPNAHSQAFQKRLAGLTERAEGERGSFWSWRETLYRFVQDLSPEDVEAISAYAYVEMLKAGYTSVGELHYLHHQPNGKPYDDRALLSRHVIQAAQEAGIAITHLPALYAYSGFGEQEPLSQQKRFLNTSEQLISIIESLEKEYKTNNNVSIGLAHHSLRAVSPEMMIEATHAMRELSAIAPIHIHVAEQKTEVEDCVRHLGRHPAEFLLEKLGADDKWTFIHCTHAIQRELDAIIEAGIVVTLCPSSEANRGDGIFPLGEFFHSGGKFAIGSDSQMSTNMVEELRWLEYVQRLHYQGRALINTLENPSTGAVLFEKAVAGGTQSLGRQSGKIELGHRADFIVLDKEKPALFGKLRDHILDAAIFASSQNPVKDVMVGGKWVVREYQHIKEEQILKRFKATMEKL